MRELAQGRAVAVTREQLTGKVRETLGRVGFYVSDPHNLRSISFDIVARRDRQLLIVKVLSNVDSLSSGDADELKILSSVLSASPLVIGLHSSAADLEDGVLYSRFGIPIVSEGTFREQMLEGVPPFVYAAPGGLYVKIDGEMLRSIRQARNISLGTLAEAAGVSRKAIQMYESGMGAIIEIASRIEEFLNEPIVMPVDPFAYTAEIARTLKTIDDLEEQNRDIFEMLREIGYLVVPTRKSPFDALAKEDETLLLTGIGQDPLSTQKKAKVVGNISRVTEKRSVIIIQKKGGFEEIAGTPIVTKDELRRADDSDDFMDLILKRERRPKK